MVNPIVISTWGHGLAANEAAWKVLARGGKALDAVEEGVKVSEADPKVINVGYGGLPDASGRVTLDACIMGPNGHAGAVVFLEHIKHPISVARLVMEKTEHIILAGEGALAFALENGFRKEDLLTPYARERWLRWRENMEADEDRLGILAESHDTIGMLAQDTHGDLAGACTTSGVAYKVRGRVGDTPVIGAGLYVDNDVGAAAGTGRGELILQICGSFFIVEKMREGMRPQAACEAAIKRILSMRDKGQIKNPEGPTFQACFIAIDKKGNYGAASLASGFLYALYSNGNNELIESKYFLSS